MERAILAGVSKSSMMEQSILFKRYREIHSDVTSDSQPGIVDSENWILWICGSDFRFLLLCYDGRFGSIWLNWCSDLMRMVVVVVSGFCFHWKTKKPQIEIAPLYFWICHQNRIWNHFLSLKIVILPVLYRFSWIALLLISKLFTRSIILLGSLKLLRVPTIEIENSYNDGVT